MDLLARVRLVGIADILTLCAMSCGLVAIASLVVWHDQTLATGLIVVALVLDGMDGAAARRFGTKHDFGVTLDSLSDGVCFCVAPAVLLAVASGVPYRGPISALALASAAAVGVLGLARLVRYTKVGHQYVGFTGLPTPATALAVVVSSQLFAAQPLVPSLLGMLCALLMVSPVPYPKLGGRVGIAFAIGVGAVMGALALQYVRPGVVSRPLFEALAAVGLALVLGYVTIGPILALRSGAASRPRRPPASSA